MTREEAKERAAEYALELRGAGKAVTPLGHTNDEGIAYLTGYKLSTLRNLRSREGLPFIRLAVIEYNLIDLALWLHERSSGKNDSGGVDAVYERRRRPAANKFS